MLPPLLHHQFSKPHGPDDMALHVGSCPCMGSEARPNLVHMGPWPGPGCQGPIQQVQGWGTTGTLPSCPMLGLWLWGYLQWEPVPWLSPEGRQFQQHHGQKLYHQGQSSLWKVFCSSSRHGGRASSGDAALLLYQGCQLGQKFKGQMTQVSWLHPAYGRYT